MPAAVVLMDVRALVVRGPGLRDESLDRGRRQAGELSHRLHKPEAFVILDAK